MPFNEREQQFLQAEHLVELQSAELKKELRLGDLVLSQVLYITGMSWVGAAGKLGSSHIMYWLPAVLLFYIPSGLVVIHLNREMPVEGGLYQWAKLRFGDLAGFLVALNLWATLVLIASSGMSQLTDNVAYFGGPSAAWVVEDKRVTLSIAMLVMGALMLFAARGLVLAKWLHNTGGLILLLMLAGMVAVALPRWFHGGAAAAPAAFTIPAVTLLNLNLLGKMSFGAFCGFDGCAIFSGEVRNPDVARTIRRSVCLSGPLIALFYIAGAACVLAFSRPSEIDLLSPTPQVLSRGAPAAIARIGAVFMMCNLVGGMSIFFNALIRLPMVAGWDHLLPQWLSRLHPKYKTPVGSIVCIGITVFAFTALGSLGVGSQESFQLLNNAGLICWGLCYLVMFSIPLAAAGEKPPRTVRIAAVSGFTMTLLYVVLSIFPIVDVKNVASFAAKISGVLIGINAAGFWYFRRASKRRRTLEMSALSAARH